MSTCTSSPGNDVGEAQVAGLAHAVAEEPVARGDERHQLSTGGLAAGDLHVAPEAIAGADVLHLDDAREVHAQAGRHGHDEREASELFVLRCGQSPDLRAASATREHAGDGRGGVDQVAGEQLGLVEAEVTGLGPEVLEVGVLTLEPLRGGAPQPHLAHRLGDHDFVAARIAEPVEPGELLALVGVEAGEGRRRCRRASWRRSRR